MAGLTRLQTLILIVLSFEEECVTATKSTNIASIGGRDNEIVARKEDVLDLGKAMNDRMDLLERMVLNLTTHHSSPGASPGLQCGRSDGSPASEAGAEDGDSLMFEGKSSTWREVATLEAVGRMKRRLTRRQKVLERLVRDVGAQVEAISTKIGVLNEIRRLYHRKCPVEQGWLHRTLATDELTYCYKVFNDSVDWSWSSAESRCRSVGQGCHLASIHSSEEHGLVDEILRSTGEKHAWVGLVDIALERHKSKKGWVWSDGSQYDWMKGWAVGQPNSAKGDQDCVFHKVGVGWFDYQCSRIYTAYICKMTLQ